jgi:Family of unknown function (DUF6267)
MNLFELFSQTSNRQVLVEGITHVEDLIIEKGSVGAVQALEAISGLSRDTHTMTVKWDGSVALVFGRDQNGQLVLVDKHMYSKVVKGQMPFMTIRDYDTKRSANRVSLWETEDILRPALENVIPRVRNQFWMGDLMWTGQPKQNAGFFVFRPNTVEYRIKVQSPLGSKIIQNTAGGIAVHTFIPGLGQTDEPLSGLKGLNPNKGITFLVGAMKEKPSVTIDPKKFKEAKNLIEKNKTAVDQFFKDLEELKGRSIITAMGPFITSMLDENDVQTNIVPRFLKFLEGKLSETAKKKFLGDKQNGWLYQDPGGARGLLGVWSMWAAVTDLKLHVKKQIDTQQQNSEIIAITNGVSAHEGYVFGAGRDKLKLIDRLGFSKANFARHQEQYKVDPKEVEAKAAMPLAAFCFGRMNPPTVGHDLVMKKTVATGGKNSFIFLSSKHSAPDNPLDPQTKTAFIKKIYPHYAKFIVDQPVQGPIQAANWLYAQGFRNIAFIGGSDRLGSGPGSIEHLLSSWNSGPIRTSDTQFGPQGREHVNLVFVSSGERDTESGVNSISGISGSLARKYAAADDEANFQRATGVGSNVKVNGQTLYQATRNGMNLKNQTLAPDSVKQAANRRVQKSLKEAIDISHDIQFHKTLNPVLWENKKLRPEVTKQLRMIAHAFEKFLDLPDIDLRDITLSGSNAAYTYTPHSDIDLHLLIEVNPDQQEFIRKYVDAKKMLFNEQHNITIHQQPVEVYVQFTDQPHTSAGVYSVKYDKWIDNPDPVKAHISHDDVRSKLRYYIKAINRVIGTKNLAEATELMTKLKNYRTQGLSAAGEFGTANLVFKILRNHGYLDRLSKFKISQQDAELSLKETI